MKLFIGGIPNDFDDVDLKEMFELYGDVISAKIIVDKETGKSKGFGFVDMADDNDARITIDTLDGAGLKGKKISVKEAEAQVKGPGGPRRNDSSGGGYRGYSSRGNDNRGNDYNRGNDSRGNDNRGNRRNDSGTGGYRRNDNSNDRY